MTQITDDAELRRLHGLGRGLIYNDFSGKGSGDGNILHAAGCMWVVGSKTSVRKYYFPTLTEARTWLKENRGAEGSKWRRCGTCHAEAVPGPVLTTGQDAGSAEPARAPHNSSRALPPKLSTGLAGLTTAQRAQAVADYNRRFGEMDRVLWCLSRHCREPLKAGQSTPVVEDLVWTIKSWWGVQGVRAESKSLLARALTSLQWSDAAFAAGATLVHGDAAVASEQVLSVVSRAKELGVPRRELSLVSKILHWLLPGQIPVYDSVVREGLGISTDDPQSYRAIAEQLFDEAHHLASQDLAWLGPAEPATLFRGLDKCLWWLGGGNAGTAVVANDPWRVVRRLGLQPD